MSTSFHSLCMRFNSGGDIMLPKEFADKYLMLQPCNVELCFFDFPHIKSWLFYLVYITLQEYLNAHMALCTSWDIFKPLTQFKGLKFWMTVLAFFPTSHCAWHCNSLLKVQKMPAHIQTSQTTTSFPVTVKGSRKTTRGSHILHCYQPILKDSQVGDEVGNQEMYFFNLIIQQLISRVNCSTMTFCCHALPFLLKI